MPAISEMLKQMMGWSLTVILFAAGMALAQVPSRDEKRAAKVRTEYLKATLDIRVPTLRPDSLKAILERGDTNLVLVDVRHEKEQIVSMLPGALTPRALAQRFKHGFPAEKRVVVYDVLGYRSGKYAEQLIAKKVPVQNLEGGILGWTHVGGALVKDSAGTQVPTRWVHVYASDMQKWAALEYQVIW